MEGPVSWIQFPSRFEQCHQCFLKDDLSAPPYLSKPYRAVLEEPLNAFAPSATRLLTPGFLNLYHPRKHQIQVVNK